MSECGGQAKWGLCQLPKGHNMGKADVRSNHRGPIDFLLERHIRQNSCGCNSCGPGPVKSWCDYDKQDWPCDTEIALSYLR